MWETIRKAVCQRIDGFELQCWRGLLRILWAARRPNKSILNEISPEYSLEGLMLKLQYFSHLMWRPDSLEKTLMLGKLKAGGERDDRDEMVGWHHQLNGHEFEQAPGIGDGQGSLVCCRPWGQRVRQLSDWNKLMHTHSYMHICVCSCMYWMN